MQLNTLLIAFKTRYPSLFPVSIIYKNNSQIPTIVVSMFRPANIPATFRGMKVIFEPPYPQKW